MIKHARIKTGGFTLIELMVVIGISAILTSMVLGISRGAQRNLDLVRGQVKIASFINKAKSLAIATYIPPSNAMTGGKVCGYGIKLQHPDSKSYTIFQDIIDETDECRNSDKKLVIGSGSLDREFLRTKIDSPFVIFNVGAANNVDEIIFTPPVPDVILRNNGAALIETEGVIRLQLTGTNKIASIRVNKFGLVSLGPIEELIGE